MPKNLDKVALSKEAEDIVENLDVWLIKNGKYQPATELKFFDQCISTGLEEEISPLRNEVSRQFSAVGIPFIRYLIPYTNKTRRESYAP